MRYVIPFLNGGVEIDNPQIKMNGYAGAPLENDESVGGFFVNLQLSFGTPKNVKVGIEVSNPNSQPEDITNVESIKEWAIAQLDAQYGVPE